MRTKQAIGRQSRAHGHAWEREVAEVLKVIWPAAVRNLSQTRSASKEGCDILGTPFWVEAKAGRKVDVKAAWKQAEADRMDHELRQPMRPILLVVKEHHRRPFVVCTFTTRRIEIGRAHV